MAEPSFLDEIRTSYDTVAEAYAEYIRDGLAGWPLGRAMLATFAELVRTSGGGPVVDVGCGPGHVTAYLHGLGLDASGIDLSPAMIEVARRDRPELGFEVGTMTALDLPDGGTTGAVAIHSIVHLPPDALPGVFAEFHRVLAPGGHLLVSFHVGDERRRKTQGYGHPMSLDLHLRPPERVVEAAVAAGLELRARLVEESETGGAPQACLLFRKP